MKENRKLLKEVIKGIKRDMTDEDVLNLLADSKVSENPNREKDKYTVGQRAADAIAKFADYDLVFVDTAGFSHKNEKQRNDMKTLLGGVNEEYNKEVYLVLSATTKYADLLDIVDSYREIADYKLIFTKLDETTTYGNLLNIKLYSGADLSYTTNGQNVPDDIEVFDTQKIVKKLLGGNS